MESSILRIMDVNLNRAREALRVIEDYARFALDDADAARAAKKARHALGAIRDAVGADALLDARDIVGDVGRDAKVDAELERGSSADVVRAAFGRLSEAARALGEYAKVGVPAAARAAEALRYVCYELEQRVVLRGDVRRRFRKVRLYVLVSEGACRRDWFETAAAAIAGGAECIQLREKQLDDGELLARARRLRALTSERGVLLAVNDRPDIARLAGADIVHVGQGDLSVRDARHIAGAAMLVGKSTHSSEQFRAALLEEPDYVAVGPMFQSPTKPQPHVAGPETLASVRALTDVPLVAIGGITAGNVAQVREAGAGCIAVCGAVCGADDPEAAVRGLRATIEDRIKP